MFTQLAVVPLPDSGVSVEELLPITAAIQVQVQRDLGPRWSVEAAVAACPSLEQVPHGAWPVVVIDRKRLPIDGFHFVMSGLPFGVVGNDRQKLSLALSHEIAEMLVDPSGQRTIAGSRLEPVGKPSRDATTVDYFVEVCDVCEGTDYRINGIPVSDFVLPGYYDHERARAHGYSFTGAVSAPRQVLEGGYITWRERFPARTAFQAFGLPDGVDIRDIARSMTAAGGLDSVSNPAPSSAGLAQTTPSPGQLQVLTLPDAPTRAWRELIADLARGLRPLEEPASEDAAGEGPAGTNGPEFAEAFLGNLGSLLATMNDKHPQAAPSIPELIHAIEDTETGEAFKEKYDIIQTFKTKYGIEERSTDTDRMKKIIAYLKRQEHLSGIFAPEIDPELGSWMWMIMP